VPSQCTIVYADLDLDRPQPPSAVASSIAHQARESLTAGQYDVALKPLSAAEVREAIRALPTGHDRLSLDRNLILLDSAALLAFAPYRARAVLTVDPFLGSEALAETLDLDADFLRVRLHDALLGADKVICLGSSVFDAIAPLVARKLEERMFPPVALQPGGSAILLVNNEDDLALNELMGLCDETFTVEDFRAFDPVTVFDTPWKAVVQIGIASSSVPGARLSDAWAGNVPVLQLVNRASLIAHQRRRGGSLVDMIVDHGKTGLLFSGGEDLVGALRDLILDPLPVRSVARSARRKVDPAAKWELLLRAILQ
jgi:hypothetical protein